MNRSTLAPILKTAVMETIDAYPLEAIHAYTGESAFKATLNTGYGAVIIYPNVHPDDIPRILGPCGQYCSNYTAEIIAIEIVIRRILVDFEISSATPEDIVLISDSKSAVQAIDRGLLTDISNIQQLTNQLLTSCGIDITFQWILGHIGIPGNERADKLYKAGAAMTQTSTNAILNTCKQILRNNYKTEWLNQWVRAKTETL
jgi:ribonuclease HI